MTLKPSDLPKGSKVEITAEDGHWCADYFPEQYAGIYTGPRRALVCTDHLEAS